MENRSPVAMTCAAAGVLLLLGSFLPWVSIPGYGSGGSALDANIGFLLPVAGAFFLYLGIMMMQGKPIPDQVRKPVWVYVATGITLLIVLLNFFDSAFSTFGASRGIGLWLALLGAIAAVLATLMVKKAMDTSGPGGTTSPPPSSPF